MTTKQVTLSNGQTVNVREPKVRDMRMIGEVANEADREIKLISSLTQMTEEELDDLSMKDYGLIQKEIQTFLA